MYVYMSGDTFVHVCIHVYVCFLSGLVCDCPQMNECFGELHLRLL